MRKAKAAGVFSEHAIGRDANGTPVVLDLNLAVRQWMDSGRQLRGDRRQAAATPAAADRFPGAPSVAVPEADVEFPGLELTENDVEPGVSGSSLVEAQTIAMFERARKLRLENDLREGQLLEVGRASREAFEFARVLRESILNIPARLSAELAGESDAARVFTLLDGALREALQSTASVLESQSHVA